MTDADRIRVVLWRCIAANPGAPKPDHIAAAALFAASEQIEHDWSGFQCIDQLQALATELASTDYHGSQEVTR